MRELDDLFAALAKSRFRSRFKLHDADLRQFADKSLPVILQHARDILTARLLPAEIPNDGRQTPMRGHPVFVAQHATATCCRGCLKKWHRIPPGVALGPDELDYLVGVIERWLKSQPLPAATKKSGIPTQRRLFE